MTKVEYDLVVIGASQGGIYAAIMAANLNARVALIEQEVNYHSSGEAEAIYGRSLELFDFANNRDNFSFQEWTEEVISTITARDSPSKLAALGVDYIQGKGEFSQSPQLAFIINKRCLRSRNYLIATGTLPRQGGILQETNYLTPQDIWQLENPESLAPNLVIAGGLPATLELAQNLSKLGKKITLVIPGKRILPQEDWEISQLIQAQLEAEGIGIYTQSPVTQIKEISGKKWVQAGVQALEADEIIFTPQRQPNLMGLNLESVSVDFTKKGIQVNGKLQTTNPAIYACGDILGGYNFANLTHHEVNVALRNALFFPLQKIDYSYLPWVIFTQPNIARVGLTEHQAQQYYGTEIVVVKQYYKNISQAQIQGETTGFCKLITQKNGHIIGAHIVGDRAGEIINIFAIAIKNKLKVDDLASLPQPNLTSAQIIELTLKEWQKQRLKSNRSWKKLRNNYFEFRRNTSP